MNLRRHLIPLLMAAALTPLGAMGMDPDPPNGVVGAILDDLDDLHVKVDDLQESVDGLGEASEELQESVDVIDGKVDTLQSSVDDLTAGQAGLQASIDGVDSKVDDLQTSVDDIASDLADSPRFVADNLLNAVTNPVVSSVEAPGKSFVLNLSVVCYFPSVSPDNRVEVRVPQGDGISGDAAVAFEKQENSDRIELTIGPIAGHAQDVALNAELWIATCYPEAGFSLNFDTLKTLSWTAWLER